MSSPEANQEPNDDVGLDCAEAEFVACMDAMQDYMHLQAKLQKQLKQGLLSLARAKYSMGPIGQAQYDNDMAASVHIARTTCRTAGAPADDDTPSSREGRHHGEDAGDRNTNRRGFALVKVAAPVAMATDRGRQAAAGAAAAVAGRDGASTAADVPPATARGVGAGGAAVQGGGGGGGAEAARRKEGLLEELSRELGLDDDDDEEEEDDESEEGEEEGLEGLREANEFLRRMRMQAEEGGASTAAAAAADRDVPTEKGEDDDKGRGKRTTTDADGKERDGSGGDGGGAEATGGGAKGGRRGKAGGGRRRRRHRACDPLQWFGVLAPPALKEAKAEFEAALETVVQLANVAQRIRGA